MYVIGVDPGKKGAIACLNLADRALEFVLDMPPTLEQLAHEVAGFPRRTRLALIEEVSSMTYVDASGKTRGQGAAASFAFGRSVGELHGVLAAHGIPIKTVRPAVWKALYALSSKKSESLELARTMFPEDAKLFTRAKDDGRAEAAILARFAAERFCK